MKEQSQLLTAADFFEQLQQDKLEASVPFSIVGMVKKSEGKGKTIEFAAGGHCANWVTIPMEMVEDVEMIRNISCKDHSHPLVKLNMKTPGTEEGKVLLALLGAVVQQSAGASMPMMPEGLDTVFPDEMEDMPDGEDMGISMREAAGRIVYRKKCVTKYAVLCDMNGCRRVPYQVCTYYPVRV